jgi:hypothetical protein
MTTSAARSPVMWVGVVIGVVVAGAALAGGRSPAEALLALAIVVGYAVVVTLLARRSETAAALAGRPTDERWEHIGLEAAALAFGISAIVVLAAFVVEEWTGGASRPFAMVAGAMGCAYLGSLVFVRARH